MLPKCTLNTCYFHDLLRKLKNAYHSKVNPKVDLHSHLNRKIQDQAKILSWGIALDLFDYIWKSHSKASLTT